MAVIILLVGMFVFTPGQAKASALHPLLANYEELKAGYPFINNLLATQGTTGVNDELMKAWIADVELELNDEIINQSTNLADKNRLIAIAQATFEPKIIALDPPKVEAQKHKEVFNALVAVYGKEIYDCVVGGKDLPQDIKDFLNHVKEILMRYMVVAEPPAGEYPGPLKVILSSFTKDASIYYTLDGSNPTIYSKKYFNPFVFEYKHNPVLLKGMASKNGVNSEPAAFDYKILPPPQVIALTPPDKATSVGLNAVVSATFDLDVKAGDLSGVTMKTGGLTVEGISASLTGRVLTIAHPGLSPSRAYIVTIPAGTVRSILYDTVNDLITWQFSTSAGPPAPVLKAPKNGSTVDTLTPTLEWNAVAGENATYALQAATSSSFSASTLVVDVSGLTATNSTCPKLQANKTYYWRVNATNELGA
ncbi:MAG: chitobiase/beta-hexosaminidase C-terminal domain-containing protein, partial [Eubacteriales bacterium]